MILRQSNKLDSLIHSRKFWALITSLVSLFFAAYSHTMPVDQAVMAGVAALAAYSLGTAVESGLTPNNPPPTSHVTFTSGTGTNVSPYTAGLVNIVPNPQPLTNTPDGHDLPPRG